MKEYEKMIAGKLYNPNNEELKKCSLKAHTLTEEYNQTSVSDCNRRQSILKELFCKIGNNCVIRTGLQVDYGINISIGENFFANYYCVMLDVNTIEIGDNVMFGPRVGLYTANHPIDSLIRNEGLEFGEKIIIKDNVWIGADSTINPGVTIGENSIIASGSVVTRNVQENVIVGGVPAKTIRKITEDDYEYWDKVRKQYI
ncbi:sugar O-acetyltransferase [Aerococcus urinae]